MSGGIEFCTLGMFILDEIEFDDGKPPVHGIAGGAGTHAVVGARLVAGPEHSRAVSWIIDVGSDFPQPILDQIQSWNTSCMIRVDKSRLTTRAWNGYGANEKRNFKYLTPKLRLEPEMLSDEQVMSRSFHMVCSSERAIRIVEEITRRRKDLQPAQTSRPIFVWEPVPDRCTPEDREKFLAACRVIDIVSPNELELGMMFGRPGWNEDISEDREIVNRILRSGIGADKNGIIVIRAGKDGCYAYGKGQRRLWLPAYHQPAPDGQSPVVDPTGAGNSFLGALAQGMVSDDDRAPMQIIASTLAGSAAWSRLVDAWGDKRQVPKALICATTAAGFVVEQIGVPNVSKAADGSECWNGTRFTERLHMYTQRLCKILEESSQTQTWLTE